MERLTAGDLVRVFETYRDALRDHQDELNALNVYPVPDGDTGTNMALTVESVLEHVRRADQTMEGVTRAIAQGSLLGARGNSGVILSQVLRGLMDTFREVPVVDARALVTALARASAAAYEAVVRPVEGTILTVVRESAEAAATVPGEGHTLAGVLMRVHDEAAASLARTPDLLPVLKEAGVVDAGARGFTLLLEAFLSVITGRAITPPADVHARIDVRPNAGTSDRSIADLRYEVMFLLHADERAAVDAFKQRWMDIGDSIVVVGGDGLYNCHIHTDTIGPAIEAALDAGRPADIRVTDLLDQATGVAEAGWVSDRLDEPAGAAASGSGNGARELSDHIRDARTGVVAVVTGEGNSDLYWDLGVQAIVTGGQSMNPSTEELLRAVEDAPAHDVIVLPNNKNVVAVAEQVDALTSKTVRVIPTRGISQGLAAMMAYSPLAGLNDLMRDMAAESARVVCGEVTSAVCDAQTEAGFAKEGSYLGLRDGRIVVVAATLDQALRDLASASVDPDAELLTLITGEGADDDVTHGFVAWAGDHLSVEVDVTHGGQALYPYLLGVE